MRLVLMPTDPFCSDMKRKIHIRFSLYLLFRTVRYKLVNLEV